jgi:DNA-binding XRE family transcriptional regulator
MKPLLHRQRELRDRLLWPTPSEYRNARLDAGLTQQEAAEQTGVAKRTLQDWERAKAQPSHLMTARGYLAALDACKRRYRGP